MPNVAILDDYQGVALKMADWSVLPTDSQVQAFSDHLSANKNVDRAFFEGLKSLL